MPAVALARPSPSRRSPRLRPAPRPTLSIEAAAPSDLPAIAGLLAAADGAVAPQRDEELRAHLPQTLVARRRGEVVGAASLWPVGGGRRELRGVVVSPKARGLGAGKALVRRLARRCEARGEALLCVTRCPRWFARLGFVPAPQEPLPAKPGVSAGGPPRLTMRYAGG